MFDILYNKTSKPIITNELLDDFEAFKDLFNQSSLSAEALAEEIGGVDDRIVNYAKTCKNGEMTTKGFSSSLEGMTLKAKAGQVALKGLSLVGNALAGIAVSFAINGLIKGIDYLINREEKLKESLSDSIEAFESTTSEIKSLDEQVKTLGENIAELQKLKDAGTISIVDDEKLQKLKEENDELERQIALLQDKQIREAKQVLKDAEKQEDDYVQSRYSLGNNVTPAEELWMGTQAYIYAVNSDNDALAKEHGERVVDMYEKIQPTLEAYRSLEEAGYTLSESEQKHFDELKKGEDAYLMYTYLTNNTKEAFVALNQEMQKSVMLRHLVMEKGMTEEQAGFVLNNIDPEDYETLYDTEFTPPALTDYATAEEYGKAYAEAWLNSVQETIEEEADKIDISLDTYKTASEGISSLATAYKELTDSEYVSLETISKIKEAVGDSISNWDTYEQKLLSVKKGTAEYNQLMSELTYSTLEKQLGGVNALAQADEKYVAQLLKENGVLNANEVAHSAVEKAKAENKFETYKQTNSIESLIDALGDENTSTEDTIATLTTQAGACKVSTNAYLELLAKEIAFGNNNLDVSKKVAGLNAIAKAAGVAAIAMQSATNGSTNLTGKQKTDLANELGIKVQDTGKTVYDKSLGKEVADWEYYYGGQWYTKFSDAEYAARQDKYIEDLNNRLSDIDITLPDYSGTGGSTKSETKKEFNWIETLLSRIQNKISDLGKTASATWKSWTERNSALKDQISAVNQEISLQQQAISRYESLANSLGLSSSYQNLVKDGALDVSTITDSDLADKISKYQEYWEKIVSAEDAIQDLEDELRNLARTEFDNIAKQFDSEISLVGANISTLEAYIDQTEMKGNLVSKNYYSAMYAEEEKNLGYLQDKYDQLSNKLSDGSIAQNSEEWYKLCHVA